jgi:lipoprotein-anchoring transpeptidase ErfK/SrfK
VINRRHLILSAGAASLALATPALAQKVIRIPKDWQPTDVEVKPGLKPGVIYVDVEGTWLYLALQDGVARRYKTSVGAPGRNLKGVARVGRKEEWPSWTPTAAMIRAEPKIYTKYRGGLAGGDPTNPLGARAMYIYQGNRDTYTRIHGTPWPQIIGTSFSSGCVRLMNDHVIDLYDRVPVGTRVVFL